MSSPQSTHRVNKFGRWLTVLCVPALLALMSWGIAEVIGNYRSGDADVNIWVSAFALLMFGGLSMVFLAGLLWAFRGRIVIEGDRMIVRGALTTTVVTPERMDGFRILNGQLYVYLRDRRFGLQIAYFERPWFIEQWVRQRTTDILGEMLEEEDAAITKDIELGWTEADREHRLESLQRLVRRFNLLVYIAAGAAVGNALFVNHNVVERAAVGALVLLPVFLDFIALSHRGHIRIDHDEGSRYPEIFTATFTSGIALCLLAAFEPGALVDEWRFYEILIAAIVAKGLLWCLIDTDRLGVLRRRGGEVLAWTVFALFAIPALWVGGSLYFVNKHLDVSNATSYRTEIVAKKKTSGKIPTYSVTVAPWDASLVEPIEIQVRHVDFESFEAGMWVRVSVREGAIGVRWVSGLVAGGSSTVKPTGNMQLLPGSTQ